MKAFITGVNGFVGRHLVKFLHCKSIEVFGIDIHPKALDTSIKYKKIDLCDTNSLTNFLRKIKPDHVYHLGAISLPNEADINPICTLETNVIGSASILEAVRNGYNKAKIVLIGSSKVYGSNSKKNITESLRCNPVGFYAISKYAMELIGLEYAKKFGLHVCCARSFNHTGAGQTPKFVCSDWAKQIAKIELSSGDDFSVYVGNIRNKIDLTDVHDVVRAYWAIATKGHSGSVYNVCSGRLIPLAYILNYLLQKSSKAIKIVVDKSKISSKPTRGGPGSYKKIYLHTGWRPQIPIEKTLDNLFAYWIEQIRKLGS